MPDEYTKNDCEWIKELMLYPKNLEDRLSFFQDTSQITVPEDPIEKVIFQDRAKEAIRKIAQNKGHILMVGRPGTGKSMLAKMFNQVLDDALGDYLRPKESILAYPGKDKNHIRFTYQNPEKADELIQNIHQSISSARESADPFSLSDQIKPITKVRNLLLLVSLLSIACGLFFPVLFALTGLAGIGAIFMFIQENNHKVQEKIQRDAQQGMKNSVKHLEDMIPEVVYDPRKDKDLMARVSEPDDRNMKGGFRHDPYQSGNLHTPAHKRTY
ncbi:MAG: hypothetical protein C0403_13305, partial [Desulfobacterium sp.]|nr:hypothetical protein [Desulfobacterium sp.]